MSKPTEALSGGAQPGDDVDTRTRRFVLRLGRRVREAREALGQSRRALAEAAGVSQRTLVLLENGTGNISVSLLYRIADALGTDVDVLVSAYEPAAAADPDKAGRVCLIGLRGAGKSTLGPGLGEALSLPFIELNQEIESICGLSINELISLYGQEGYRQLERQALEKLVDAGDALVLAAAGGVVADADTFDFLLRHFHTIWLKASPEEHMQRVRRQGDIRPMAGKPAAMDELRAILTSREADYARADVTVSTCGQVADHSRIALLQAARALLGTRPSK